MSQVDREIELDHTLIALADPTRRAILRRLVVSDARVTDLAEPFQISLNSVSKHIKLLERANLVIRHRRGREHYLSFRPDPLASIKDWIARQESFWAAGLQALDELLRAESAPLETPGPRKVSRPKIL